MTKTAMLGTFEPKSFIRKLVSITIRLNGYLEAKNKKKSYPGSKNKTGQTNERTDEPLNKPRSILSDQPPKSIGPTN